MTFMDEINVAGEGPPELDLATYLRSIATDLDDGCLAPSAAAARIRSVLSEIAEGELKKKIDDLWNDLATAEKGLAQYNDPWSRETVGRKAVLDARRAIADHFTAARVRS